MFIVINTCKNYYKTVESLINQINNSNFPNENILIVSGQEDENSFHIENDIKIAKVKYTGLHLTSAIYINENIDKYPNIKYWLLLPDTIKFGDKFFNNIIFFYYKYLKNKEIYVVAFINPKIRATMDMGILHIKHIMNMTKYLEKIKTFNISQDNLVMLKYQLIYDENTILGLKAKVPNKSTRFNYINDFSKKPIYFINNRKSNIKETLIKNGKINQVYFPLIDLYKFQRNFKGLKSKLIMTL